MLRAFTVGFCKVYKSCLLLLVALPGLIDTLCTVASLKVPAIIIYNVATKVLDTELFPQHTIADLNFGITFILSSHEKPLRWKKIHTHRLPLNNNTSILGNHLFYFQGFIYSICAECILFVLSVSQNFALTPNLF